VVAEAEGNAARFKQVLAEYAKAPGVTRDRLYLDMMQTVLGSSSKILVDQKAGNNLLYLPLDKLISQSAPSAVEPPRATAQPEPAVTLDQPARGRDNLRGRER
jgi:membrane protease subunit HflK